MNIDCNPSPHLELLRPQWRLARVLQVFLILLYAHGSFVLALALQGKKVLRVLVDGTRRAIKRLAGACGRKNECPKRIHYSLLRRNRGLSPIVSLCMRAGSAVVAMVWRLKLTIVPACFSSQIQSLIVK